MFWKKSLAKSLGKWSKSGGDLTKYIEPFKYQPLASQEDAAAVCSALGALRQDPGKFEAPRFRSPLHNLAAFFQNVESRDAFETLSQEGLPLLRCWIEDCLAGNEVDDDDVMFILKILAMYRQPADIDLIARAARMPHKPDGYIWSIILGQFDHEHPLALDMVEALRSPLPTEFILVSYLDMCNGLAIAGKLDRHPFSSEHGIASLENWLRDENEDYFSYAHSATAALPFIEHGPRDQLLNIAGEHPSQEVRMEAAWAQAKSGDSAGLQKLSKYCLDPNYSSRAVRYLEELGASENIPEEAKQPDFVGVAEMAEWLAHPSEYGRPPDEIELYDSRELFWPPTDDHRALALVKYTYDNDEGGEPDVGYGMVGSVTFALFGEATAELSAEDVYALHCCWELEGNDDPRAPRERTVAAGRKILSDQNQGF